MKIYQDIKSGNRRHDYFINHGRVLKAAGSFSRIQMRINPYTILLLNLQSIIYIMNLMGL